MTHENIIMIYPNLDPVAVNEKRLKKKKMGERDDAKKNTAQAEMISDDFNTWCAPIMGLVFVILLVFMVGVLCGLRISAHEEIRIRYLERAEIRQEKIIRAAKDRIAQLDKYIKGFYVHLTSPFVDVMEIVKDKNYATLSETLPSVRMLDVFVSLLRLWYNGYTLSEVRKEFEIYMGPESVAGYFKQNETVLSIEDGRTECDVDFFGPKCGKRYKDMCSGHGVWMRFFCKCDHPYHGPACKDFSCDVNPGKGICVEGKKHTLGTSGYRYASKMPKVSCYLGWSGMFCDYFDAVAGGFPFHPDQSTPLLYRRPNPLYMNCDK